jgi:hypothetical protein
LFIKLIELSLGFGHNVLDTTKHMESTQMERGDYNAITQVVQQQQPNLTLPATFQPELASSCVALVTIAGLTLFVREIRLLVKTCKDS